MTPLEVLQNVRVASPCPKRWDELVGDDRTRYCVECNFNVFNLSDMTADEAAELIRSAEGRLCVSYYRRADGTIMTRDCGVAVARRRRRMAWVGGAIAAVLSLVAGGVFAGQRKQCATAHGGGSSILQMQPFSTLSAWFPNVFPQPAPQPMVGKLIALPPVNNGNPGNGNAGNGNQTP